MVKTKASLLLCCAVLCAGCGASGAPFSPHPEVLAIPAGAPGRFLSLGIARDQLCAVFSDAESTTLKLIRVPLSPHLPATPPNAVVIDRIDSAPPLSPSFGAHVLSVSDAAVSILYLARQGEEKSVLKLATKAIDAPQWTLDVMEPPGAPLAILPAEKGALSLFWASGSLWMRGYPDSTSAQALAGAFEPRSRASVFAPFGFTAFDGGSNELWKISRSGGGFSSKVVPGAYAVHSSALLPDGRLAVLSWDAEARRLILLEERQAGGAMSRTTVTLCDETTNVALLPVHDGYLFLFDESRRGGVSGPQHTLSLISRAGARYRKTVLLSGTHSIDGFSAVRAGEALYVIAVQGGVKLLRVDISS
jgi:hypothetical protein